MLQSKVCFLSFYFIIKSRFHKLLDFFVGWKVIKLQIAHKNAGVVRLESIRKQIRGEPTSEKDAVFREREVLSILVRYLKENDWTVKEQIRVKGGSIDIGAEKEGKMMLIEAKGEDRGGYTSAEMNFQMGLGQLMSRMKHSDAEYGLAFPFTEDFKKVLSKYRGSFAFEKLGIYLIPVKRDGTCRMIAPNEILKFLEK